MPIIEIVAAALDRRFPRRCRNVDRHVADEEVAFAARLLVRGREAVVLEFPWPESAIQFRANHVLHHRADIPDAERRLLPFLGLLEDVPDDKTQAARCVQANPERLRGEELLDTRDSERLDCLEIHTFVAMDAVQQRDIFAHIADASAAGSTALGGQHTFNSMAM